MAKKENKNVLVRTTDMNNHDSTYDITDIKNKKTKNESNNFNNDKISLPINQKTGVTEIFNKDIKNIYYPDDKGPFILFAKSENINPMKLGFKLTSLNYKNILSINKFNKNTAKIIASDFKTANGIIGDNRINKVDGLGISIPEFLIYSTGYIDDIDLDINIETILENMESEVKIRHVERMTWYDREKQQSFPSKKIKIIFRSQTIPERVKIFFYHTRVKLFLPNIKKCTNCLIYGHVKKWCRNKKVCNNCTEIHDDNIKCTSKCKYCKEIHATFSFNCQENIIQKEILKEMYTNKISFSEAKYKIKNNINETEFPNVDVSNRSQKSYVEILKYNKENKLTKPKSYNLQEHESENNTLQINTQQINFSRLQRENIYKIKELQNQIAKLQNIIEKSTRENKVCRQIIELQQEQYNNTSLPNSDIKLINLMSSLNNNLNDIETNNTIKDVVQEKDEILLNPEVISDSDDISELTLID